MYFWNRNPVFSQIALDLSNEVALLVELTAIRDAIAAKGGSGWNPDRDTPVAQGIIAKSNEIDLDDIPF